jgi:site-specific DNA recombinase
LPPIGYRIVAAEQRGAKTKKKLEIDPLHADTVRLIYRLALEGDGTTGQMGVKNIVSISTAAASSPATAGAGASVRFTAS